jgi:Mor family transcriptional regulator
MKIHELGLPKSEIVKIADEWIFNTRNKSMLFLKLEGYTYEEIAEKYCLSTQRTKEIILASQNLIVAHCM